MADVKSLGEQRKKTVYEAKNFTPHYIRKTLNKKYFFTVKSDQMKENNSKIII